MMKKWLCMMLLLVFILFGSVLGFNLFKQQLIANAIRHLPEQEIPVTAMTLEAVDWTPRIETIGFIEARQGVSVASVSAGQVTAIRFSSGDQVLQQQCLVELDSAVEQAQLRAKRAHLSAAKARYQRYQILYRKRALSKEHLDEARADHQALMADINSLQETIARRQIKAPFSGVIGLRQVQLGQYLAPGTPIASLQDLSAMRLRFHIAQNALEQLHLKQKVDVQVDAYPQQLFQGVISAIDPIVNPGSGLIQVQAEIPNNTRQLRAGMFARVAIQLPQQPNQIVLPQSALSFTLYGETAYILQPDTQGVLRAQQVTLSLGERQQSLVHVLKGLKVGDKVVTTGQVRLSQGSRVKVVDTGLGLHPLVPVPML